MYPVITTNMQLLYDVIQRVFFSCVQMLLLDVMKKILQHFKFLTIHALSQFKKLFPLNFFLENVLAFQKLVYTRNSIL